MKRKELVLGILVIVILFSNIAFAGNIEFTDVKPKDWYFETIMNLTNREIIEGYNDKTFRPNREVTTAEFLKLSMEAADIELDYTTSPWHRSLMDKALELDIITMDLYSNPDKPIKRKDVAVVLSKLIEKTPSLKSEFITERSKEYDRFKYLIYDTTKLSQEYRNSIYKLFEYGLMEGSENNKKQVHYKPESNLTRAEIATIVERLIEPSKRLKKYLEYPNRKDIFTKYGDINNLEFGDPIYKMVSTYYIKLDGDNERFLYTFDEGGRIIEDVALSDTLNPNFNKQIYELVKATIDKDSNYFVEVEPGFYDSDESKVSYQIAKSQGHAINGQGMWNFAFYERRPYNVKEDFHDAPKNINLSENAVISLWLSSLWQDFVPDGWVDYFYADKLRTSFIALFGEKDGCEVYEYVLNEYVKYRLAGSSQSTGYKCIYKTKDIGNIHIDYITGDSATLRFHFSYKE